VFSDSLSGGPGYLIFLGLLSGLDGCSVLFSITACSGSFRAAWRADSPSHRPLGISNSFPLRHPVTFAVAFAALAILKNARQPYGIRPLAVKDYLEKQMPDVQQWNSFSRIRAEHETTGEPALAGPSPKVRQLEVSQRFMAIDGSASTAMFRFDGDLTDVDFL
jgi:hypothetical protein